MTHPLGSTIHVDTRNVNAAIIASVPNVGKRRNAWFACESL